MTQGDTIAQVWRVALALVVAAGCGRVAFDRIGDAPSADTSGKTPQLVQVQTAMVTGAFATLVLDGVRGGDLIVIATLNFNIGGTAEALVGIHDDAGNTYQSTNQLAHWEAPQGLVQIWYAAGVHAGTTTIALDSNARTTRSIWAVELANVSGFDTALCESDVMQTLTPVAPAVKPTHTHAAIISIMLIDGAVTMIHAGNPFTALDPISGDGAAYLIAPDLGTYAPAWDATMGAGSNVTGACTAAFEAAET